MYTEQVSIDNIVSSFIYFISAVSVLFVVIGISLIDSALVSKKNLLHTWVQKYISCIVGGTGMAICGYAIWQWQFYTAFGVDTPLRQALSDWWLGSHAMTSAAITLDPKTVPEADTQQVFVVFFMTFAMATTSLIHSGTVERIKDTPLYIMSFFAGAVFCPLVGYLTWGPVSPLTNLGLHDFEGVLPLYVFSGTWSLVVAWRLGPRHDAFLENKPVDSSLTSIALGSLFIMIAIPLVSIGSTWITPGKGVSGISMTQSGIGLILINVFCALLGGGISGAILGNRVKSPVWIFLGPVSGAVMSGSLFDIGTSIECIIFGLLGPIIAFQANKLLILMRIDEPKVVPLGLATGGAGMILVGFTHWGTATGGFPGVNGKYGMGHAHITPWLQILGVFSAIILAAIPAFLICLIFEKMKALRISSDKETAGMDLSYWSDNKNSLRGVKNNL